MEEDEEEIEEPTKAKAKKEYVVVNVPTQHTPAIQTPSGELLSVEQGIARVLNIIKNIEKNILG